MSQNKVLCIYHKNCLDGFGAAWVVRAFHNEQVDFVAADYGDTIPDLSNRRVVIADFSYDPKVLLPAARTAKSVTIIDHHATAIDKWAHVDPAVLAEHRVTLRTSLRESGAMLAWKLYFGKDRIPTLFSILQDYDLFRNRIPNGRQIIAAMKARGFMQVEHWDTFTNIVAGDIRLEELAHEGDLIHVFTKNLVVDLANRNGAIRPFLGFDVPMVNMPYEFRDEAGELLSKDYPFSVTYDDWHSKGVRKFSLRSNAETGADVEALCKAFGGGGHKNASGFTIPLRQITNFDLTAPAKQPSLA